MKAYLLLIIICCIYRYASIEIRPVLKENILKFGYSINYKYEGMLAHSFDRFNVVTKFILQPIKDLKFSNVNYDDRCAYLQEKNGHTAEAQEYILDLILYCRKIRPYVHYYKQQIKYLNDTTHHILKNEIDLILPQFPTRQKRGIITMLVSGFIGLAYEGISRFLHNRRHKALHKTVKSMDSGTTIQHYMLMHLEDSMVMYSLYHAESLEKLINTVHCMHDFTSPNEKLIAGQ